MTKKMFSIRDSKAEAYGNPVFLNSHGEAERSFQQLAQDPKTTINQFPTDFDLYYLGDFDDISGKMELLPTPQHVIKAVQFQRKTAELTA